MKKIKIKCNHLAASKEHAGPEIGRRQNNNILCGLAVQCLPDSKKIAGKLENLLFHAIRHRVCFVPKTAMVQGN